ncbi:alkaline phosphatase [Marinihelvus fidelis]|uniref:Alkaline phosphatase n=1 Tax=Marinihelvus fidelis TaxID=2613842 RepID=A0A5N0TI67_9GAMM|nr:alkaline phosphatase [Marinihelvus fidelis]KAA9134178.1 alkaline phosphatase [Marinihelvus fidelis]
MRTIARLLLTPLASVTLLSACAHSDNVANVEPQAAAPAPALQPRNVIFLMGDGMGFAQVKSYREYADDPQVEGLSPLPFDHLLVGSVATDPHSPSCESDLDRLGCEYAPYEVTDSASSATAYATGKDTVNGKISESHHGERLPTVLELAARQGLGTGVVSTSQVTHATPASFVTHAPSRRDYADIADQFFDNQANGAPVAQVILGGGVKDFRREDRDVAADLVDKAGYTLVSDRDQLLAADDDRLLGLFAPVGLPRHWDRPDTVPTLADMTQKAIDILSDHPDGFFLMVEGSQIDWAAHGNDIAGVVSEMEGFTAAIEAALAYADNAGDTLVVITADHETGGLSLARDGIYAWLPQPLRQTSVTPAVMTEQFLAGDQALSAVVASFVEFDLTEGEQALLDTTERESAAVFAAINELFDLRTNTGWTTSGHTGMDVPLYASGPGSEQLSGVVQNQDLGAFLMRMVRRPGTTAD